jgi:hypothetical protein
LTLIGIACVGLVTIGAQGPRHGASASRPYVVGKNAFGQPDLEAVWSNNSITPLQRPAAWAGKTTLTDAEVEQLQKATAKLEEGGDALFGDELIIDALDGKKQSASHDTETGNYNGFWLPNRDIDNRTSLIIDPPDGRIPPAAPGAAERARAQAAARRGRGPADAAQDLGLSTRCVHAGTPNLRAGYQSYFAITQGPGVVALRTEMIHDTRVFSISSAAHVSKAITMYHGDSRAHWDGDTLVVDTTNFSPSTNFRGSTTGLHLIEKLKRVSAETIEYYVTVEDPAVWSRPWTLMVPLKNTGEEMYEFACHEGNYGLPAILRGARAQERGTR